MRCTTMFLALVTVSVMAAPAAADASGPGDAAQAAETRRIVEQALARLSVEQREVVLLRHFQGLRFREVAETLGINENTAKSRKTRSRSVVSNRAR